MNLEQELLEIKESQREQSKILLRLESVIVDDPATNRVGYGSRIKKLEDSNEVTKKAVWYVSGIVAVVLISLREFYHKIF